MNPSRTSLIRFGVLGAFMAAALGSVMIGDAAQSAQHGANSGAGSEATAGAPTETHEGATAKAEKAPEPEKTEPSAESTDRGACVAGPAALEDIKAQRARVEAKEKELAAKEKELKAIEKALHEEFRKLEEARGEAAKAEELRKKENEGKVAKIVETVESMSPKSASTLLASLDDALAVTAMQRMTTPKLAKIMNVMEPGRSSRLTELLAGVARSRTKEPASRDAAEATDQPKVTR